jgi:C1A family cysteine protease
VFSFIIGTFMLGSLPGMAEDLAVQKAPASAAFSDWVAHHQPRGLPGPLGGTQEGGVRVRGRIPHPVDLSHLKGPVFSQGVGDPPLPAFFDLRTSGVMTPVKDQGQYGTCWAFACMGSLEAATLKAGAGLNDLSEWYHAYYAYQPFNNSLLVAFTPGAVATGEDPIFDQGGNDLISTALLARGNGAVNEVGCQYQTGSYRAKPIPAGDLPNGHENQRVPLEQALYLFDHDTPSSPADLKYAVSHFGPAVISIDWEDSNYSDAMYTYRNTQATEASLNHEVCIVGWNDCFETCRFPAGNRPSRPGAWIVRNSWSRDWGLNGYFYISYDSRVFDGTVFVGGPRTAQRIRQYDPLGWCGSRGFGTPTAYAANLFQTREAERITAVSFYAGAVGTSYEISLTVAEPGLGTVTMPLEGLRGQPQAGVLQAPGYHIIPLATPMTVAAGSTFAVTVKLTTPGYLFPIPIQDPEPGYSESSAAHHGRSFISADGITWQDLAPNCQGAIVCLKAFAEKAD